MLKGTMFVRHSFHRFDLCFDSECGSDCEKLETAPPLQHWCHIIITALCRWRRGWGRAGERVRDRVIACNCVCIYSVIGSRCVWAGLRVWFPVPLCVRLTAVPKSERALWQRIWKRLPADPLTARAFSASGRTCVSHTGGAARWRTLPFCHSTLLFDSMEFFFSFLSN